MNYINYGGPRYPMRGHLRAMRVTNNYMSTAIQRTQQTPICIMKHLFISMYFASARTCVTELNSVTNDPMLCGAWEPGSLGVGTTGQHLWGLTNGVPLRSKKRSPRIVDCVWPRNAPRHFLGVQERRSPRPPLL